MYSIPSGLELAVNSSLKIMAHHFPKVTPDVQINIQNNQTNLTMIDLTKAVQIVEDQPQPNPTLPSSTTQQSTVPCTAESQQAGSIPQSNLSSFVRVES
jgi:hypothetical protein